MVDKARRLAWIACLGMAARRGYAPPPRVGMSNFQKLMAFIGLLAASSALAEDVPYSFELSALAQRYYRLCRAEARLRERISQDFNDRQLPMPQTKSFLETLPVANRRDAQLVCLGAAAQQLDDLETAPIATLPPSAVIVAPSTPASGQAKNGAPTPPPSATIDRVSIGAGKLANAHHEARSHTVRTKSAREQPATDAKSSVRRPMQGTRVTIKLDPPATSDKGQP